MVLSTTLPVTCKPNTQLKKATLIRLRNHFVAQTGKLPFPYGWNCIYQIRSPETQSIDFLGFTAKVCANYGDLKPIIDENQRRQF